MKQKLTPTLALIVAGGLAAGIALARPAASDSVAAPAPAVADTVGGFLGGGSNPDRGVLENTPAESKASAADQSVITVAGFEFDTPLTVAPGASITVTNRDATPHTVTGDGGAFDTGAIGGGASAQITAPSQPGTYTFFCSIHPSMQGELTVQS